MFDSLKSLTLIYGGIVKIEKNKRSRELLRSIYVNMILTYLVF